MASRKSKKKKSKAPKANGIRMQINAPEKIGLPDLVAVSIPENKPGTATPLEIDISVTNNTSSPLPFLKYGGLIPELVAPDGQVLKPQEPINRQFGTQRHHWSFIRSGTAIGFPIKARLSWQNNSLQLEVPTNPDYYWEPPITPENSWIFNALQAGTYQLRFTYQSPRRDVLSFIPEIRQLAELERITTDRLVTPFMNLCLVQPREGNKGAVEIEGIGFETLVPEQLLSVPQKQAGAKTPVQLAGIRITNNKSTFVRFSFFVTLIPEIVAADGQIFRRGRFSDWSRVTNESDLTLAMPGEDVIFFPSAGLWWLEDNRFLLIIDAGDGSCWSFQFITLGTYHIHFNYVNNTALVKVDDPQTGKKKQIENIWTGMVSTPFVEFRLVQP